MGYHTFDPDKYYYMLDTIKELTELKGGESLKLSFKNERERKRWSNQIYAWKFGAGMKDEFRVYTPNPTTLRILRLGMGSSVIDKVKEHDPYQEHFTPKEKPPQVPPHLDPYADKMFDLIETGLKPSVQAVQKYLEELATSQTAEDIEALRVWACDYFEIDIPPNTGKDFR